MQVEFIDYKAALEKLDPSRGTREDLARVGQKLRESPADVTDADLVVYGFWLGEKSAAEARARRDVARTPHAEAVRIHQPVDSTPATVPDDDLTIYKHWYGDEKAAAALARRDAALRAGATKKYATIKGLHKAFESYSQALADNVIGPLTTMVTDMNERNKERNARIEILEKRVAELESSHAVLNEKALKGGAPWQRGVTYAVNDCVQHDGGLWKCVETHVSGANFSHEHFLLQIKRGRDGKDAAR